MAGANDLLDHRDAKVGAPTPTAVMQAFNNALNTLVGNFDARFQQANGIDLDIRTLDFHGLFNQAVRDAEGGNNGAAFGVTNVSSACITPFACIAYFFAGATGVGCDVAAFSDKLHPSAKAHQLLGELAVQTAMAPVPEPAEYVMMIAGLLLIAGIHRRRAKASVSA